MGPDDEVTIPEGTERIDGEGRSILPGLADMHVHLLGGWDGDRVDLLGYRRYLNALLYAGVTSVLDVGNVQPYVLQLRQEVAAGRLTGPRIHATGALVDGANPVWPSISFATSSIDQIEALMSRQKSDGVDMIKAYVGLDLAMVEELVGIASWLEEQSSIQNRSIGEIAREFDLEASYSDAHTLVTVHRIDGGGKSLRVNGKSDASTLPDDMSSQVLIGQIPMVLHPDPKNVLVIGLGSGVTLAGVREYAHESIDCIEISEAVFKASAHFSEVHGKGLTGPGTRIIIGDGRAHVRYTDRLYDVITSEPSNLWVSGMATRFTGDDNDAYFDALSLRSLGRPLGRRRRALRRPGRDR